MMLSGSRLPSLDLKHRPMQAVSTALALLVLVASSPYRAEAAPTTALPVALGVEADSPVAFQLSPPRQQWAGPLWVPPVPGVVVDFFRPPLHPYGPGNRGLEFAVAEHTPVSAVGSGAVSFAGRIGPSWHVVVDHPDGLRSGYSHLSEVAVEVGDAVVAGQSIGRSSKTFHLSARLTPAVSYANLPSWGERRYVDPLILFGLDLTVRLVPAAISPSQSRTVSGP